MRPLRDAQTTQSKCSKMIEIEVQLFGGYEYSLKLPLDLFRIQEATSKAAE
jgi:hypothetical protein